MQQYNLLKIGYLSLSFACVKVKIATSQKNEGIKTEHRAIFVGSISFLSKDYKVEYMHKIIFFSSNKIINN